MSARLPCAVLVLAWSLAGCGRLGFDRLALTDDAGARDAGSLDAGSRDGAAPPPVDAGVSADAGGADGGEPVDGGVDSDAAACPESPCRVLAPQCGCAPGLVCETSGGVRSCAAHGTAGEGELCTTSADCAGGRNCSKFGGRAAPGICISYCGSAADCPFAGSSCTDISPPDPALGLCSFPCNAVTQTGCPAGTACYVFPVLSVPDGVASLGASCTTPSGLADGALCTRPRDCGPGLTCVNVGAENRCAPQCIMGGAPCVAGTCTSYVTPLTSYGVEYGVCG